jgi:hypothetical protein
MEMLQNRFCGAYAVPILLSFVCKNKVDRSIDRLASWIMIDASTIVTGSSIHHPQVLIVCVIQSSCAFMHT